MNSKLGATGRFPDGKLVPSDEGAINTAIGEKDGYVVIDFGKSVVWVAMSPQQAADFAAVILKQARRVARKNNEVVSFDPSTGSGLKC